MHTLLIVITVLSLAAAIAMGIVIVRLLREDRERSDARVAALAALAEEADSQIFSAASIPLHAAQPSGAFDTGSATPVLFADAEPAQEPQGYERPPAGELFAARPETSPWGRRVAIAGCLAGLLGAVVLAGTLRPARSGARPAGVAAAAETRPLELLDLRHVRDAQGLTISGRVKNPEGSSPASRVVATALVFGPNGTFLTSGRAPLDVTTITPGGESPFVIKVTLSGDVSRYRIGFRTEGGRVLAHVDKRRPDTLASKQEQP
jgi:hypothetical protein